ncbi:zinc finger protein 578-like [Topomyia yanbarensis]|uniref:zinc finger protein 578-like n=1 Tax=Topomyia yanbarensis TaxID=2498891 RepID=UPI00273B91F0|nr:zinc finger protein 578-like [Topomyia yanbarensis]
MARSRHLQAKYEASYRQRQREKKLLQKAAMTGSVYSQHSRQRKKLPQKTQALNESVTNYCFNDINKSPSKLSLHRDPLLEVFTIRDAPFAEVLTEDRMVETAPIKIELADPTEMKSCALCLRACGTQLMIDFSSEQGKGDFQSFDYQQKLDVTLGHDLNLERCSICRTCWRLIETFADFKDCCLKAQLRAGQSLQGMIDEESDPWLSSVTLEAVDQIHNMVQTHTLRMNSEEIVTKVDPRTPCHASGSNSKLDEVASAAEPISFEVSMVDSTDTKENIVVFEPENVQQDEPMRVTKVDKIKIQICEKCQRRFDTKAGLAVHVLRCTATEEQGAAKSTHTCNLCSVTFTARSALVGHLNKHKGIKPYKCRKNCETYFYGTQNRRQHEHICSVQQVVCYICGLLLNSKRYLRCHMNSIHGDIKYACGICGRTFPTRTRLEIHELTHSNERKHGCDVCSKTYKSAVALKVHKRIHTQEKPFKCPKCGEAFMYTHVLKKHVKRVH